MQEHQDEVLIELGAVSEETKGVGDTEWEGQEPLKFA